MAGMTMGLASAAAFPAPFVTNGAANAAIVYGANSAPTDLAAANSISTALANSVTSNGGSVNISGEHVLLNMHNSYLTMGKNLTSVFDRPITKSDMPTLLADGTYRDSKNSDHDFTQKINMAALTLNQFNLENFDTNVSTSTPAVGFNLSSSNEILTYTLNFQSQINMSQMKYTTLKIMGKPYYVLDSSSNSLTLLDSASATSLNSGQSTTINAGGKTYSVTASYVDSSQVRLTVNGQETDMLTKGETYKLSDGSYVGIKNVYSNAAPAGSYQAGVTFTIGSGKIVLTNGSDVEVNGDSVSGVTANLGVTTGSTNYLNNLTIQWKPSDTVALTKESSLTMPAFGGVSLSFAGMTYPSTETTTVSNDGGTAVQLKTAIQDGSVSLDILGMNKTDGKFIYIGKDNSASNTLVTSNSNILNNVKQYNEFVLSQNGGRVAESHVYKVTNFANATSSHDAQVTLTPQDGGSQITLTEGQSTPLGEVTGLTLKPSIDYATKTVNFIANNDGNFATLYTKDGLTIGLPTDVNYTSSGYDANHTGLASYDLVFKEADKDGNIASTSAPSNFTLQLGSAGSTGNYKTSVNDVSGATIGSGVEVGDSNVYNYMIQSPLATAISHDTDPTQETATVTYHGGESYGKLYLTSPDATVSNGASAMGNIIYKDSEVANITAANVILVGGSCINTATAKVLGVPEGTCGEAFTQATGIGAGQFLIEGFPNSALNNKFALVVAGYQAADTTNAATYLTKKDVDTSKKYVGTSATEATLMTQ